MPYLYIVLISIVLTTSSTGCGNSQTSSSDAAPPGDSAPVDLHDSRADTPPADSPRQTIVELTLSLEPRAVAAAVVGDKVMFGAITTTNGSQCNVRVSLFSLDGEKVGQDTVIKSMCTTSNGLTIAGSPSSFLVAWDSQRTDSLLDDSKHTDIYVAVFDHQGNVIEPPQRINRTVISGVTFTYEADCMSPKARWLGNRYLVAWKDHRVNDPKPRGQQFQLFGIYGQFFAEDGKDLSDELQITQQNYLNYPFSITGDTTHTYVAYGREHQGNAQVWLSSRKGFSDSYDLRMLFEGPGRYISLARFATDDEGNFLLLSMKTTFANGGEKQQLDVLSWSDDPDSVTTVELYSPQEFSPRFQYELNRCQEGFVAFWQNTTTSSIATLTATGEVSASRPLADRKLDGTVFGTRCSGKFLTLFSIAEEGATIGIEKETLVLP